MTPDESMRETNAQLDELGKDSEEDEKKFESDLGEKSTKIKQDLEDHVSDFTKQLEENTNKLKQATAHEHPASSLIQLATHSKSGPSPIIDELMHALSPSGKAGENVP